MTPARMWPQSLPDAVTRVRRVLIAALRGDCPIMIELRAMSAFDPKRRFAQHAFDYFRTANLRSYDGLPGGQATGFYARHQKTGGELCNALLLLVLQYSFPLL